MGLEKINQLRKEKGLTIEELSKLSNVPHSTLKKISAGITTNPSLDTMKAVANALNCTLDDLDDLSTISTSPTNEQNVIEKYRTLNGQGKEKVNEYIDDIYSNEKYKKIRPLIEQTDNSERPIY